MNPPTRPCILRVQDLSFAYPAQPPLVSDWSATLGAGVTLLHGDTGSGKSTLLRVLAGALAATGRLTLTGVRLDSDREAYRRKVFWCDPATWAFDPLTVRECTASLSADDAGFSEPEWQALVGGSA